MRSRAVILPTPADPFLLTYWFHLFDTVWGEEIDKLYIYVNSPAETEVAEYVRNLCLARPKVNYQYLDHMGDHGPAIDKCLDIVQEEFVMLIEDDGFIFKKGMVDRCFTFLEEGVYDIVGGKRGSCATEILEAAQRKWGVSYEGLGDQGPNFWPNFFFCRTDLLKATDRNFAAKAWYKGETIPSLDYTVEADVIYGDTMVNTSLQLRAMVPIERILCLPQYHGSPEDIDNANNRRYLFDGEAPWTHVGSLSSGIDGVLRDDQNRALARRCVDEPKGDTRLPIEWCNTDGQRREWERRAQWWLTFYEFYMSTNDTSLRNFADLYGTAIKRLVKQYSLSMENIVLRQNIYRSRLGI